MWTKRLNGAGLARGQRGYTWPTAQSFDHMPTALDHGSSKPKYRAPIHCLRLQRIDAARVPEVRPLQAHTSFGNDLTYSRNEAQLNHRLLAIYMARTGSSIITIS